MWHKTSKFSNDPCVPQLDFFAFILLHNQSLKFRLLHISNQQSDCIKSNVCHKPVTLNKDQGHSNWFQTVMFKCVYHYAKFREKKISSLVLLQANFYRFIA